MKGECEVEETLEIRTDKNTRYGRRQRELLVRSKGYVDPSWVGELDLNCISLLRELECKQKSRNRFEATHSHEN